MTSPKIVAIMCVKDEADLLPQVYPHIRNLVDYIYVYDDGSSDGTWDIVKEADYAIRKVDDKNRLLTCARPNYHHLLGRIKLDFINEDVWCIIAMGDRFFLNQTPREIVSNSGSHQAVEGVQLDFLRHRLDPWTEENDPFPDYSNIRKVCRWATVDERCIVAFKLTDALSYVNSKYPWPQHMVGPVQFEKSGMNSQLIKDMPYLEHQGRRSPKGFIYRYASGSRIISSKNKGTWDISSFAKVLEINRCWFAPYKVIPWINNDSLDYIIYLNNCLNFKDKVNRRYFFWGMEAMVKLNPIAERIL